MKNKNHIFIGIGLLILAYFMYKNYTYMEEDKTEYPSKNETFKSQTYDLEYSQIEEKKVVENKKEEVSSDLEYSQIEEKKVVENKKEEVSSDLSQEYKKNRLVFQKFTSSNYDIEPISGGFNTINKRSIHTFDFAKQIIILEIENENSKKYRFNKTQQTQTGYQDFRILNSNVNKIWFSSNTIGYEFKNGEKLVFYEIRRE